MSETANIHLQLPGETRTVQVRIPEGQQTVAALFPAARVIAHEIIDHAVGQAEQQGRQVSCCAGCGACCRQVVVISLAEAEALAHLVAAMPAERQGVVRRRFADAVARLEAAGLLDPAEPLGDRHLIVRIGTAAAPEVPLTVRYFRLQIACPFLEDESCSIHADRPLVCREYLVTSPAERCSRLFEAPVEKIDLPVLVAEAMVRTIDRVTGVGVEAVPLVLALEWAEHHAGALGRKEDGLVMLQTLVEETQKAR
jgi:Fe-S-cluster containining protein